MFDNLSTSLEHIKSGKLRLLGVGTAARLEILPDVPTIAETVPGFEAASVFGVGVPTGTPADIIEKLNREFNAALANPHIQTRLLELTFVLTPGTAAEFGAQMAATTEKWGRVVKFSGVMAD
jgi:tripartite-type tricarboxylate transporter receptor subunit TctC